MQQLRLYVAGSSPRSIRAIQDVSRACESWLTGRYSLEVIDIYKEPARAAEDRIVAIPTLIRHAPGLVRRMIGDLSEAALLRQGIGG
jgi:circadian clock protein KaiB